LWQGPIDYMKPHCDSSYGLTFIHLIDFITAIVFKVFKTCNKYLTFVQF